MKYLDVNSWNRKEHFHFFNQFSDPFFGVTISMDVTNAYAFSKKCKYSFFIVYLHACMKAINAIENFRYRIKDDKVLIYERIDVSPTILRPNQTFGFSYVFFDKDLKVFNHNFQQEKERVLSSNQLFPPINQENCVYCSALPWLHFSAQKEPMIHFNNNSIPKLSFGKFKNNDGKLEMPVSIIVNHALMDGIHLAQFFERYQKELNSFSYH